MPSYSATDKFVEQQETYEKIAIGECNSDADAAVETHAKKIKEEIKENDEKLEG
jgi:hypothetical protein